LLTGITNDAVDDAVAGNNALVGVAVVVSVADKFCALVGVDNVKAISDSHGTSVVELQSVVRFDHAS
jgi:hypothetical protein